MNIALIGYGKMGREIEKIARQRNHKIVCIIDVNQEDKFDSSEFKRADVAIEFTTPESAYHNYKKAFAADVPVVSGTTGWLQHLPEIKSECEQNGKTFFYASNFSVGVNLFFEINRRLASLMNQFPDYDMHIEEVHHIHKKDAPSGTAITLAEDILSNVERKMRWELNAEKDEKVLPILSFREGEVPGTHAVIYESEFDTLNITHEAKNRKGFALGAVLAAEFTKQNKGFLSMNDLLNFL